MPRLGIKRLRCGFVNGRAKSTCVPLSAQGIDFRALLENSLDMICQVKVAGDRHRFLYATPSTFEILGWSVEELLQMSPADIYTQESVNLIAEDVRQLCASPDRRSMVMLEAIRKDGRHIWLENKVRLLSKKDKELSVIICSRDVTQRKLLEDRLAKLALLDGLTGASNRRAFDEAIAKEWRRALRDEQPLSLLLLDVDRFKPFNDTYGHLAGDDCLRAIVGAISGAVTRPGDMVARYGGEEFAVLLPATPTSGAETLALQLCRAVAKLKIPHSGGACAQRIVTVSCGVSTASAHHCVSTQMPEALLLAADSALYRAKRGGRNCVAVCLPLGSRGDPLPGSD